MYRSAGRTRDGGSIVGAHSMFYSDSAVTDGDIIASPAAAGGDNAESEDGLLSKSPNLRELDKQIKVWPISLFSACYSAAQI